MIPMVQYSLTRRRLTTIIFATVLTVPSGFVVAEPRQDKTQPPQLEWPVDCTLGETCWIARYVDREPGPEKSDYHCKAQTEDKHNGTDIVVRDLGQMQSGVSVRAAADGRVLALRNGMPDIAATKERRAEIRKQGCGNILIIGHGGGWQTRYCHLKNDSLLVEKGDRVKAGQPIGEVGLSGSTEYPHLHFMLGRNQKGQPIQYFDPFDGGAFEGGCSAGAQQKNQSLWRSPIAYAGPIVMPPLITAENVTRQELWQAQPPELPADVPMLRMQARGFHTLPGDIWRFSLVGPDGNLKFTTDVRQRNQRQLVGANAHANAPKLGFDTGVWTTTVNLLRDGIVMGSAQSSVHITPN